MKKILKLFLIVPILLLSMLSVFACKDDTLKSISLSIENSTPQSGYYVVTLSNEKNRPIQITTNPSGYSAEDFSWESSAPSIVSVSDLHKGTYTTKSTGKATITATYKNSDGSTIKGQLKILVQANSDEIRFSQNTYETTYTGLPLQDNYTVVQDDTTDNFQYKYYKILEDDELAQQPEGTDNHVDNIVDAGTYQITCIKQDTSETCSTILIVKKATLSLTAKSYEFTYSESFPNGLYNEKEIPTDLTTNSQVGESVYGLGADSGTKIGKSLPITIATPNSDTGSYETSCHFELFDDYKKNYESTATIIKGSLKIFKKSVVIVIQSKNLTYGDALTTTDYEIYSYKDYTEAGGDISKITGLRHDTINFKDQISMGTLTCKYNGEVKEKNNSGLYDVLMDTEGNILSYELCHDNSKLITNNLSIKAKINGRVKVSPRSVVVLPDSNQQKVYGTIDPANIDYTVTEGSFVPGDNVNKFLSINYVDAEGNEIDSLTASSGKYFYKLNEKANVNYIVSLNELAIKDPIEENNEGKIKFEVVKCPIVVKTTNAFPKYVSASSSVHTVSYYKLMASNNKKADYTLEIESITVNGEEITTKERGKTNQYCLDTNFETNGFILLKNGSNVKFELSSSEIEKDDIPEEDVLSGIDFSSYYLSYRVDLATETYSGVNGNNNYQIIFETVYVCLNKVLVTIIPTMTPSKVSKVYDATEALPNGFEADYTVECEEENFNITTAVVNSGLLALNENAKAVGEYKIKLTNNIVLYEEMEYYDIKIDESRDYFYTITPMEIKVLPNQNQTKVYGAADPEFSFEQVTSFPTGENTSLKATGYLSRVAGEDVGQYEYRVGSVYISDNYIVSLDEQVVTFSITPRTVRVKPYSYVINYGDDFPNKPSDLDKQYEIEGLGDCDPTIIVSPEFEGYLAVDGAKVGDFYKVNFDADGETIIPYNIVKGTLTCNNNYVIDFDPTATLLVNKKEVILDFEPKRIPDKASATVPFVMSTVDYSISTLINGSTSELTINSLKDRSSYFEIENYDLKITYSGDETVAKCYKVVIGKNIVYNIDVKIITIAIVDKATHMSSTINQVYNGMEVENKFMLICQTAGYKISEASGDSVYTFAYASEKQTGIKPKDVGSYVATVDLTTLTDSKIVIVNDAENGNTTEERFEFQKIGEGEIVENAVLNISNRGYLNISRANISFVEDKLSFVESLSYSGVQLTDISTTYRNTEGHQAPIFTGVGEDTITLKRFSYKDSENNDYSLNFSYQQTNYTLYNYEANKYHYINVTIQAENTNYNMLNIDVPLYVSPKNIVIKDGVFVVKDANPNGIGYDGSTKAAKLNLTTGDNEVLGSHYEIVYSYYKVSSNYSKSKLGAYNYYEYDVSNNRPNIGNGIHSENFSTSALASGGEFIELTYEGKTYLVFNNSQCLILEDGEAVSPTNAGIYLCVATCESKTNYTFAELVNVGGTSTEQVVGASKDFYCIYEIQKSESITIDNWKDKFYYTTQFDLAHPNLLPFEFEVTPNLKSEVKYHMSEPADWPASNVLNVGNYTVNLTIETDNYYVSRDLGFKVEQLSAEITFPTLNTYLYQGENKPVTDFLNSIKITEKDKDGKALRSFFYTYGDNNSYIKLEFFDPYMNPMPDNKIPWDVNNDGEFYTLIVTYGNKDDDSNYYGTGAFEYSIIKRAYDGEVRFQFASIPYSPIYTPSQLYNLIYTRMFSIGLESGYEVKLYIDDADKTLLDPNEVKDDPLQSWTYKVLVDNNGSINLRVVVKFFDGYTEDYEDTAVLTINKATVSQSEFDTSKTSASFVYDGYSVYNYLIYNNVSLNPEEYKENETKKVQLESSPYIYYIKKTTKKVKDTATEQDKLQITLEVRDNFKSILYNLTYEYQLYNSGDESYEYLSYVPVDPNDNFYKTIYSFSFGVKYQVVSFSINPIQYKINKVDVLYVLADNWTVTYDGTDFVNAFNIEQLTVKNNNYVEETNMKVSFKKTADAIFGYSRDKGVCLTVHFTKAEYVSGSPVDTGVEYETVTEAGTYFIHISLLYNSEYHLEKFFNHVRFGSNDAMSISTYKESLGTMGNGYGYNRGLDRHLIVNKKPYGMNNWYQAITLENYTVDSSSGSLRIILTPNSILVNFGEGVTSVSIKQRLGGSSIDIGKNDISRNYSFADFEINADADQNVYVFEVTCDNNHSCDYLIFEIRATTD